MMTIVERALSRQRRRYASRAKTGQASCGCDSAFPLRGSIGSEFSQRGSGDEMALKIEGIVDGGMHTQEALRGARRLKSLQRIPSSGFHVRGGRQTNSSKSACPLWSLQVALPLIGRLDRLLEENRLDRFRHAACHPLSISDSNSASNADPPTPSAPIEKIGQTRMVQRRLFFPKPRVSAARLGGSVPTLPAKHRTPVDAVMVTTKQTLCFKSP